MVSLNAAARALRNRYLAISRTRRVEDWVSCKVEARGGSVHSISSRQVASDTIRSTREDRYSEPRCVKLSIPDLWVIPKLREHVKRGDFPNSDESVDLRASDRWNAPKFVSIA